MEGLGRSSWQVSLLHFAIILLPFNLILTIVTISSRAHLPVVPGKESYDDWLDCRGFGFSGTNSYFPHMNEDWEDLVKEKMKDQDLDAGSTSSLREEDACCVIGSKKSSFVLSGTATDDDHLK